MKNRHNYIATLVCLVLSIQCLWSNEFPKKQTNFVTELENIRNIVPTKVDGEQALFLSSLTGQVGCYTTDGKKLWVRKTEKQNAVVFQITAGDLNNDGQDEYLAVSADGYVQCWDKNGKSLWVFRTEKKVRLAQVAIANTSNGAFVYTGGNNNTLYKLNGKGKVVATAKYKGSMGRLFTGNFTNANKESLMMITYVHDKFRWEFFGFVDPETLQTIKVLPKKKKIAAVKGMITDVKISDINKDGKDDVLFFISGGDGAFTPSFAALDSDFNVLANFTRKQIPKKESRGMVFRYAHNTGVSLMPFKNEIIFQFGRVTYLLDAKGNIIDKVGLEDKNAHFSTYSTCFLPEEKKVYTAGEVSGGNAVYSYDVSKSSGWSTSPKLIGKTAEVNENLENLYEQVLDFKLPSYQKKAEKPWVMIYGAEIPSKVTRLKGADLVIPDQYTWSENYDRSKMVAAIGKIANKKDKRKPYKLTQKQILQKAKACESRNQAFTIWAGHGSDPFITSIETIEKIIEVAPNTCYGFVYAEMANTEDPRSHYFVKEYMPRLAKACRKSGKAKLYFRYKQMFWAKNIYIEPWKDLFLSKKYADILVPCTEDTNSFTQDLNLAGRIGMKFGGYVNDFGMRLIDDNVTGWRPFAPGGQKSISPFLRSGVMRAAYGARYGVVYNFKNTAGSKLNILWALMKSGVIPQVDRENIASIGSWHLIDGVHESALEKHGAGHNIDNCKEEDYQLVMNVSTTGWGGTSVPDYDLSKFLGVEYRWTNFTPELPYGMIPIAPIDLKKDLDKTGTKYTVSDHAFGYVNGKKIKATEFGATLKETSIKGNKDLAINVKGAAWSAIQLDKKHIRLILIDPGYITPADRNVIITLNKKASSAVDILSKEKIKIQDEISVEVPAGSMRFIDFSY
ncbi:hypothetical protein [Wenyingzhuangia sp. IMCC45574]